MSRQALDFRRLDDDESAKYKFELCDDHSRRLVGDFPACESEYASIVVECTNITGTQTMSTIYLRRGYQWDGPSGPTIDTADWLWASLVHDALYQLGRLGQLRPAHRKLADAEMFEILKAEGMPWWRRAYSWVAVRVFGQLWSGKWGA